VSRFAAQKIDFGILAIKSLFSYVCGWLPPAKYCKQMAYCQNIDSKGRG
jgi:hypothetical protein